MHQYNDINKAINEIANESWSEIMEYIGNYSIEYKEDYEEFKKNKTTNKEWFENSEYDDGIKEKRIDIIKSKLLEENIGEYQGFALSEYRSKLLF